jgi:putative membrane protein
MLTQVAVVPAHGAESNEGRGQFTASDYKFARDAARGGMFEVNLGNLALSTSKNTGVQQFGQRMVTEHRQAGQNLQQIASRKNATLPTEVSSHQQKEVDRLSKLSGPEFDKAYVMVMIKAHKADEKAFKKESEDGDDADLKAFAADTLTMVRDHLKAAEDLDKTIKQEVSSNMGHQFQP